MHSSTQFAVLLGNGRLFAEAGELAGATNRLGVDQLLPESFVENWRGAESSLDFESTPIVLLPSELVIRDADEGYENIRAQLASRLLLGSRLPWKNLAYESPDQIAAINFALGVLDRYLKRPANPPGAAQSPLSDSERKRFLALVRALGSSMREWIRFLEYNLGAVEPEFPTGLAANMAQSAGPDQGTGPRKVVVARSIEEWLVAMARFRDQEWYEEHVLEHRNGRG